MRLVPTKPILITVAAAALIAGAVNLFAAMPALGTGAEGITTFSDTSTGAIVTSTNNGNGVAVEGVTGATASGQAVYGIANNSANAGFGVHGKVFGPSSTALYGEAVNTDTGHPSIGMFGYSNSGNGIYAYNTVAASAAAYVQNAATGNTGVGVQASSGGVAVIGTSSASNGVLGQSGTVASAGWSGVLGQDRSTSGSTNFGVAGTSTNGTGVAGTSTNSTGSSGTSTSGYGVYGSSSHSNGVFATSAATPNPGTTNIFTAALGVQGTGGGPLIIARGSDNTDRMSLDNAGNLTVTGTVRGTGTPLSIHRLGFGTALATYAAQQSMPTVEDFGVGRLLNGRAYVRIDPAFAAVIDRQASYLVFITPKGPNRGLYVTDESSAGFAVRENPGGASMLAFDYRIVAKPADAQSVRLPYVSVPPFSTSIVRGRRMAPRFNPGYIPSPPKSPLLLQGERKSH